MSGRGVNPATRGKVNASTMRVSWVPATPLALQIRCAVCGRRWVGAIPRHCRRVFPAAHPDPDNRQKIPNTELRPIEYFSSNFSWWHRRLVCAAQAKACGYKNNHLNATRYQIAVQKICRRRGGPACPPL